MPVPFAHIHDGQFFAFKIVRFVDIYIFFPALYPLPDAGLQTLRSKSPVK
jgi:hypothetical protein